MHDDDLYELRYEKHLQAAEEDARDEIYDERFQAEVVERIDEIFDENFKAIFRRKVKGWSAERWPQAEASAHRVGREARAFADRGFNGPAVVWSATCVEIILRDLTLSPIFVGLFLGEQWADMALKVMLDYRSTRKETRTMAKGVLYAIAAVDVDTLQYGTIQPWGEIDRLLQKRNGVVHSGQEISQHDATWAVDVAAALYATLLPPLRELCGLSNRNEYSAPADGTAP